MHYKYTSTKEYVQAFPVAYRQWRADDKPGGKPGCNKIHGYALSIKLYFGCNDLDVRNWAMDFGGLKPLKDKLDEWFDHTLLLAIDDPYYNEIKKLGELGIAKIIEVEKTGCEALADFIYWYVNAEFLPNCGAQEAERLWCYRVEVRETQSNMAFREGHRDTFEEEYSHLTT